MGNENLAKWGPILLVGGSGRLGYYIAQQLLQQPECGHVISISRSSQIAHRCDGVEYRVADITHSDALGNIMREVVPETIINAAAPPHTNASTPTFEFEQVFVHGQDMLMGLAMQVGTKYMICTTSSSVIEGFNHVQANETAPMWPETSSAFPYWVQRARAERRLLAVDSSSFQTLSLRLPLIIGEREYAFVPEMLKTMKAGNTGVQIGSDTGRLATVSGQDAARAHILALHALRIPNNNVHGEAFYILGKTPLSFWTMARIIWSEAGWKQDKPPFVMPKWAAKTMAVVSEAILWPFGVEPQLTRHTVRFMCNTWTYDGSKAKERLQYVPMDDVEDQLRKSVRWHLKYEAV
jgi:nucleoside-diphosphate-sugar epimerase